MNRKPINPIIIQVAGLIVTLGIAWGADALTRSLGLLQARTFSLNWILIFFWSNPLFTLILAFILLGLFWFMLIRAPRNAWVSLAYLLIGILIVAYPALYYTPALCCWMPDIAPLQLSTTRYLFSSAGFIAMIGLLTLVLPKGKRADQE
jgi:hypothetical protein